MNLQIEAVTSSSKAGYLLKKASDESTGRGDKSVPDDGMISPGITVNGTTIDQNQNCTSASEIITSVPFGTFHDEEDLSRPTEERDRMPTEEELLKQLEEANRLIEADEKSYAARAVFSATPGHSRKGSESSIVSSTSSNSFYSQQSINKAEDSNGHTSETLWEIWGRIINDWDSVKKKQAFLRELVRKGIPHEFRGMAWQLILGVHDSVWKQEYAEHMKKKSPCEKLIRRDIARTFPDHDFFKEKDGFGQESLFNVMKAYSLHDREVGYCQGSGFIVGLLLMQMPEEDAFAVLVHLMQEFKLRELFKPSMAELGLCMYKLECLIQELLPTLLMHFQTQNFDTSMYASSWFLTLFVTSLPLSLARRIMDLFISEGMEMIFRVGVAILQSCQEELLTLDMEGLLKYLQKDIRLRFEQEADQDNLLHTAYSIKYSHKQMKKLEKEYTALKTKENEDQIELRRLRTENRLLHQRIENLEKESSTLADKLVQDQVTWAQEAEQSYALRNELSVLRQQLQETQKKLFDAEDILGDIRTRSRIIEDAVHLDEAEERNMIKHLQEELIAVRLRETDTAITIKELKLKISELEDTNLRLQRAPSNDVQQLQEELIAVKLREAEANLSLKELRMKVNEIENYWEAHMERVRQSSPKEKGTKMELRHLQEEIMALKLKEARAVADVKDAKQKLMELETQNHICTNQIRRIGEENKDLKKQLEEAMEREKDVRTNIKDLTRKLDDIETKRKEETMMARIKEAESIQKIAELTHRIAEIDIQREEVLAAGQLQDTGENQELKNKLHDLQDEVLQLQFSISNQTMRTGRCVMTDSFLGNNSDEELDAEINDSKNLDRTLSDIIEGKSPNSLSRNSVREIDELESPGFGNFRRASKNSSSSVFSSFHESSIVESAEFVHKPVANERLTGHVEEEETNAIKNNSNSGVSCRSLIDCPEYSREVTLTTDCADSNCSDDESDLKGKSYLQSGLGKVTAVKNNSRINSKTQISVGNYDYEQTYNPDISSPGNCFPGNWELYEEVVEIDSNMETRLISSSPAEGDDVKSSESINKLHKLSQSKSGKTETHCKNTDSANESCCVSHRKPHIQNNRVRDDELDRQETSVCTEKSIAFNENGKVSKVDNIPDVVIYEPSCNTGLLCGCEETDDQDFVLKESTV